MGAYMSRFIGCQSEIKPQLSYKRHFNVPHTWLVNSTQIRLSIAAGTLLVASDALDASGVFRDSVVLLTHHGRGGARGVIISAPQGPEGPRYPFPGDQARHFLGGPIGMPGTVAKSR